MQNNDQKENFVAVRKNGDGDIVEFQTSSGKIVDYKQAQQMVQNGEVEGYNVFRGYIHLIT